MSAVRCEACGLLARITPHDGRFSWRHEASSDHEPVVVDDEGTELLRTLARRMGLASAALSYGGPAALIDMTFGPLAETIDQLRRWALEHPMELVPGVDVGVRAADADHLASRSGERLPDTFPAEWAEGPPGGT